MELTFAEELLLLALDEEKGSTGFTSMHPGLAGALLADLAAAGALEIDGGRIVPVGGAAPVHPVLAGALTVIAKDEKRRTPGSWVSRLPGALKPIVGTVAAPLVESGVLDEERRRFLGLFPDPRYRELDPGPERALRERLHRVLVEDAEPAEHDAVLIGLLQPLGLVDRAVAKEHRRAARKRAKTVAEQGVSGRAVHDAVQAEVLAAIMPAIVVATTTTTTTT